MSRFLVLLLVALALGAAAALYLRADSGYVLINYGPWILETSLLGFAAGATLLFLAVLYGARLLITVVRLPTLFRDALGARRERIARESFEDGLGKLLEGQWKRAEVDLVRRAADHRRPALSYLLAARAAQNAGVAERRDHYLDLASRAGDEHGFLAAVVRAELLLEHGDQTSALSLLEELHRRQPQHTRVIELLADAQVRAGAWEALRQLLADTGRQRALQPSRYNDLMQRALQGSLQAASASARLESLKSVWNAAPASFRQKPELRRAYAEGLARLGADAEAAALITKALGQGWDGPLVATYGRLEGIEAVSQLATVEAWLAKYGEEPELLRTAGRVCIRNRLWGKARSYLEGALRREPTADAYLALAQMCDETKNAAEAQKFYKLGLELAAKGR